MSDDTIVLGNNYNINDQEVYVDTNSNKVVEQEQLTPWDIIKVIASKMNIKIKDAPNKSCNKCYGRGYIGFISKNKQPIPCKCIFQNVVENKQDNQNTSFTFNREIKRKMMKNMKKTIKNNPIITSGDVNE